MFNFFRKHFYFVKIWENKMELIELESGHTILKKATDPFSTKRVVFSDFAKAERLMTSMFKEIDGKKRFRGRRFVAVQQVDYPEGGLSEIEKRALVDSCEHSGALAVVIIEPGSQVSNADALYRLKSL